ncbi:onanonoxo-7-onima-8-eninoihtemlysoneda [Abortiporus biennis]|nr:onanonoxo-7-onima-8-eninoihtemlysoneda [Abortiporus biennis]
MSLLFKNLRIHQVFGANTDVGKTLLTSALVRASATNGNSVFYLKPVSTGPMEDADDEYVKRFAGPHKSNIVTDCLFRFGEPVSPELAARLALNEGKQVTIPTDSSFVTTVATHIRKRATQSPQYSHMYVETAGGVHSPTLSGTTQLDSYRPLFLPTVLIGDSKLGGISATISSYESLILRGYIVDAILLFRDEYYRNWEYLEKYFAERGVHVSSLNPPPPKDSDYEKNLRITEDYYQHLVPSSKEGTIFDVITHLDKCHTRRLEELDSMPRRTLDTIWWPFVQHGHVKEQDITVIDSASSDVFTVYNRGLSSSNTSLLEPQFDGSASWWTQALGHAHPSLTIAAARAAGRYGHVIFPQATHLPALKLAERLVKDGPGKGWASRAFFSDDGSTAMEVAIKMALRAFAVREDGGLAPEQEREKRRNLGILGLKGSYHGDTIGAMDACEEGVYTCEWHEGKGYWLDPPTVSVRNGKTIISLPPAIASETSDGVADIDSGSLGSTYDVSQRLNTPLATVYRKYLEQTLEKIQNGNGRTLGALVLEPIVMGAGGMIFVDPLFQRVLIDVVRGSSSGIGEWSGLPVVFDEVFVGLYRLGLQSTIPLLGVNPDISVNAKILTGGLVPMAITMASKSIFDAFFSDKKVDALLHGHSYTAYPIGCEIANETLEIIDKMSTSKEWSDAKSKWVSAPSSSADNSNAIWSFWDPSFVESVSKLDVVGEVMAMGTVFCVKLRDESAGYQSHSAERLLQSIKDTVGSDNPSPAPGGAPFGINFRTLGNIAYFMLSLNTSPEVIRSVEKRIWTTLTTQSK